MNSSRLLPLFLLASLLAACGGGTPGALSLDSGAMPARTLSGRTVFVSADLGTQGMMGLSGLPSAPAAADSGTRTVEQGDIYRVLDGGRTVLNLNAYRGLQVLDIADPAKPAIAGRVALTGYPVEMYVVGTRAYALMNNHVEYKRVLKSGKETLEQYNGAALVTLDIADRAAPRVVSTARLPGYIAASRMSSGGGRNALYAATTYYDQTAGLKPSQSIVYSFSIDAQGNAQARDTLSLGGSVAAIQAAGDRLLVARNENAPVSTPVPGSSPAWILTSSVGVIDISSPDGAMRKGADLSPAGVVAQKNNMHVQGNIVRIVSADNWNLATRTNTFETFDIADLDHPRMVDRATFGKNQTLFATTFLADRAFFVTYERKDPFHAFSITADGRVKEESEFIVSGWNDFFMPALGNTRLVGIGRNDQNNRNTLAVSLYDIVNLKNPNPLLARAEIALDGGWSEANWDDRAFTVLDNGANALAPDGKTRETGLVLLPFSGYDQSDSVYKSGVQIFTYSATTLTRRGTMSQDTQVRRSFVADAGATTAVNLSDSALSLFNIASPAAPVKRGALTLAPSFSQYVTFGSVGVRIRGSLNAYGLARGQAATDTLEVVPVDDPEAATALAGIAVPAGSNIYNAGGKLVVVSARDATKIDPAAVVIATYDLSTPSRPQKLGELVTTEIAFGYPVIYAASLVACPAFAPCGPRTPAARVVGNALVFDGGDQQFLPAMDAGSMPRYWNNYVFQIVDLSGAKPALLPKLAMDKSEEAVGLVQDGSTLWINFKKPEAATSASAEPAAKYYVRALDLTQPAAAKPGPAINVPGQLMAARGATLYTAEGTWSAKQLAGSLNVLEVQDGLAYLQASRALGQRTVTSVLADGNTVYVAVLDSQAWKGALEAYSYAAGALTPLAQADADPYAALEAMRGGRLLVRGNAGFLLYDSALVPRAFVAGYAATVQIAGSRVYAAANGYGILAFDFTLRNIAEP